ncbi:MAG TPA: helical backbone metal receptor [Bryobacteraceae bacterium]|nr:helical backbone metal receptor [Bryobacteraceae bacterium]
MMRFSLALLASLSLSAAGLPRRIVSLSPNLTEILYGVGAFGRVVGVSDYCTWPPAVRSLPSVGGWQNPNLERLAALRPDLVVLDSAQAPFIQDNLKALGMPVLVVADDSVEDVFQAIETLGHATGCEPQARRLADSTRAALTRVSQSTAGLAKPRVVLIVDRSPGSLRGLVASSAESFLGQLAAIAGARIVAPPFHGAYGYINKEDLLALDPDAILDFVHERTGHVLSPANQLSPWQELPELRAVRAGRVYPINEDYVPHASERMVRTAELFRRLIHERKTP